MCLLMVDGSMESKDIDRFDKSMREGSTMTGRPEGSYEHVQVVMLEEVEGQKPVSKEFTDGYFDHEEGSVEDMHLDDVFPCAQYVALQDEQIDAWLHQLSDEDIVNDLQPNWDIEHLHIEDKCLGKVKPCEDMYVEVVSGAKASVYAI